MKDIERKRKNNVKRHRLSKG